MLVGLILGALVILVILGSAFLVGKLFDILNVDVDGWGGLIGFLLIIGLVFGSGLLIDKAIKSLDIQVDSGSVTFGLFLIGISGIIYSEARARKRRKSQAASKSSQDN